MKLLGESDEPEYSHTTPPWYTTYSDMMTLLLTFFVLLYALSSNNKRFDEFLRSLNQAMGRKGSVGADIHKKGLGSGILKTPKGDSIKPQKFGLTQREITEMERIKKELDNYVKGLSNGSKISTQLTERGLVIRFAGQLLFESGKADIRPESLDLLSNVSNIIKNKTNSIRVEGFTDNMPISNSRYPSNWELSTARATAVLRFLINIHKVDPKRLSAAGYGEYRSVYPNDSDINRSQNRRVDIVLLYPSLEINEPKI